MNRRRTLIAAATILGLAVVAHPASATDPWPVPRPVAGKTPAFHAPDAPSAFEPLEEASGPLRLADALALALMGNPDLQGFSWEVRAAEARVLQAGKFANPELSFRHYRLATPTMGDRGRARVFLSQEFELGGKRKRRAALATADRALAGWDYEARRIDVATLVASRFAAVLGAQHRVESEKTFVEFHDEVASKVAALVRAGRLGAIETHRVARRAGLARIDLAAADSALSTARSALAATWGGESPRFDNAVGKLGGSKPVPGLEAILEIAERNAPALARQDAEIARAEAALKLARSGRAPDMEYGVGVRREQGMDDDYLFDLEIELPIFDRNQGGIREAQYALARGRAARQAARTLATERIAKAYHALVESESRSRTLDREVLPAARAILAAYVLVFEENGTNLDDLLDARRDVARAEADRTRALTEYRQQLATLEGLIGHDFSVAP